MINDSYQTPRSFKSANNINPVTYKTLYDYSINNNDEFWANFASKNISWSKKWDKVSDNDFSNAKVSWFTGGELNVAYNCIDRHLEKRGDKTAIIFEPNNPEDEVLNITYKQLHEEVGKLANTLKSMGISKGDRVCLYMPMTEKAVYSMLACARLGAIHCIVFAGFSAEALSMRIHNSQAKMVITCDEGFRGTKTVPLKHTVDQAIKKLSSKEQSNIKSLVFRHTNSQEIADNMTENRDFFYDEIQAESAECPIQTVESTDPLFILYTSGSTGTPKGLEHGTGGYLTYTAATHKFTFDHQEDDIFWCTADIGWVTGHSYAVYGPLANGGTTLIYEGLPQHPNYSRMWDIVQKHKVNVLYTAPTLIRSLRAAGDEFLEGYDLSSLRILGSVGEPISPESWHWLFDKVGKSNCPIVDTWWQTETGGHLLVPLPGATEMKPGSASIPFFGIKPVIVDSNGEEMELKKGEEYSGVLCIKNSWPGQAQNVWQDRERFKKEYFNHYKGLYFTGDGCRVDSEGHFWITGRVDDVINVSGHRMGTAEIESALLLHENVTEAAVIGFPHKIKGEGIYAYVTTKAGVEHTDELKKELVAHVRNEIGPIATLDAIQWSPDLPKTRSGKIMRRILRKIAHNDYSTKSLGDTSTLLNPKIVDKLIDMRIPVEEH
ncbi:MAG: acetate--CoA ligase [Proteobacteria bacterium]|nr:acetate--CoA ligase [Pseudomonadota bacterium]